MNKKGTGKDSEKTWTVGVQLNTIIHCCFCLFEATYSAAAARSRKPAAVGVGAGALSSERIMSSSSSLTSGISASPSAAASTARHRHDGAPQQLRVKAAVRPQQQQQLLHGGRRHTRGSAVVVRAGPGPLSEIEPDLEEDAIDVYRTNGIAPVRPPLLLLVLLNFAIAGRA
jgi:hypothetical protein